MDVTLILIILGLVAVAGFFLARKGKPAPTPDAAQTKTEHNIKSDTSKKVRKIFVLASKQKLLNNSEKFVLIFNIIQGTEKTR